MVQIGPFALLEIVILGQLCISSWISYDFIDQYNDGTKKGKGIKQFKKLKHSMSYENTRNVFKNKDSMLDKSYNLVYQGCNGHFQIKLP